MLLTTRLALLAIAAFALAAHAVGAPDPSSVHPRLVAGVEGGPQALRERVAHDEAAARRLEAIRARVQPYVERHRVDPAWIVSRLQMYWQGHHTQVYVKDGLFVRAGGEAPVPTVRFTGGRDTATAYMTPRLEDVKPYMGENDLLYLQNRDAPGKPWEWVAQPKTGRIVEAINMRIAELGRDAAFLYWYTGQEEYAAFAGAIFDTYMRGMYYRAMPVDLNRAHDQTIVGLQSFEVIHEDIVGPLAETFDFMHGYLRGKDAATAALYDAAFKKWADVILANGVPWNNWNLIKARFVLQIAAVLEPDAHYADGHGSAHYVKAVTEGSGTRQWSLRRLLDYGYDAHTGIWNESPGYSLNVLGDYVECLDMLERLFGIDLLPQMPVLARAASALPQYLLPNGRMAGFGDTRYDYLRTSAIEGLQEHAERHGNASEARHFASLRAAIQAASGTQAAKAAGADVHALLAPAGPASATPSASLKAYQTPTFYAPNASWLIQRNTDALVISQAGSAGNHAHANGIAMELFTQGLSIAPESGRGSGYLQNDHLQYYAQFPAHNTVVVDGASTYPSMKIDHPLSVAAVYPQAGSAAPAFPWATFSDVGFVEPATDARQRRVLGTVRLDDGKGYFVDIFRSRRRNGKDKYHDYIYHNLGQSMTFESAAGQPLATAPSQRLAFADGDLFGYDYWSDRKSLVSTQPLKAHFALALPERTVDMQVWLQGDARREFFSVQAPPSTAWVPGVLPEGIDRLPLPTLVVRHKGEAWTHPFTAVMDASGQVQAVEEILAGAGALALRVRSAGGREQTIISNDGERGVYAHRGQRLLGRYGIVALRGGQLDYLFLGHGKKLAGNGYALTARQYGASAALWREQGRWFFTASAPVVVSVPPRGPRTLVLPGGVRVQGRAAKGARVFDLPAMPAGPVQFKE